MRFVSMILVVVLIITMPLAWAQGSSGSPASQAHTYTLDLFSLISFGLAIAALVLSCFMGWLSWEFYKKSSQASEKSGEAVARIEVLIGGIQDDIADIIQRTVAYWIDSSGGDSEVTQSKQELYAKFAELEEKLKAGGQNNSTDLLAQVAQIKTQMDELSRGLRESRVRTMFPTLGDDRPAVRTSQQVTTANDKEQSGLLSVSVLRPVPIATGTGKFSPIFASVPTLETKLVKSPYENVSDVISRQGVGKTSDFNVHLNGGGTPLRTGEYVFEYAAKNG